MGVDHPGFRQNFLVRPTRSNGHSGIKQQMEMSALQSFQVPPDGAANSLRHARFQNTKQ